MQWTADHDQVAEWRSGGVAMHGRPITLVRVASFERRDPVYPYPLDAEVTQKRAERVHTTPEARVPKNFETSLLALVTLHA